MAISNEGLVISKSTESPYQLDNNQTVKASKALLSHVQAESQKSAQNASKKNLLATQDSEDSENEDVGDTSPIWLNLSTKQHIVDKNRLKPSKIAVPHSLNISEDLNICLITTDPQRAVKNVIADPSFPTTLSTKINRIIGITKLQARYKTFESRRQLLSEHDAFLADDRIITRLPSLLGKVFYKGISKRPIPISIAPRNAKDGTKAFKTKQKKEEKQAAVAAPSVVAAEITRALTSVTISLRPGTVVAVRIGIASFTPQQLADNISAVVPKLIEKHVVKGWRNVRSISIKSPTSLAVPIWLSDSLWTEEENVIATNEDSFATIDTPKEGDKKRKRDPVTIKSHQSDTSKKPKVDSEAEVMRKTKLAKQKAKAFHDE